MIQCPYCAEALPSETEALVQETLYGCPNCLNPFGLHLEQTNVVPKPLEATQDIRFVAPPGSVIAGILGILHRALDNLPVLPEVPQRILSMVHDPLTSMSDLARVINEDAVVSMKILKLANSAFYASTHEIHDLATACSRVGLKMLANTVTAIANSSLYRTGDRRFRTLMSELWQGAVVTAFCADEVATWTNTARGQVAFMAGLIHEIGKVVLLDIITVRYRGNVGRLREDADLMVRVLEKYHNLVGLHVVQKWALAPAFAVATYCHPRPATVPFPEWAPLTHTVSIARAMSRAGCFGVFPAQAGQEEPPLAAHPSAVFLKLEEKWINDFMGSLPEKAAPLLEVFSMF